MISEEFKTLRDGLRDELSKLGYTSSPYFHFVGGEEILLNFDTDSRDGNMVVTWGPKWARKKMFNPKPKILAMAIVNSLGKEKITPPQPIITERVVQKHEPVGVKIEKGVTISQEEFEEYKALKISADSGIWIDRNTYAVMREEMRIGYVPADLRKQVLDRMDKLIRRMS